MKSSLLNFIFINTALILFSVDVIAGDTNVGGRFNASYAKQEVLPIPDAEGHMLILGEAHGSNASTGKVSYMDGAQIINKEIDDLIQGNGPHSGYVSMSKDGEKTITRWSGKVTTVLDKDGNPKTTMKGNWEKVAGAGNGRYSKAYGTGTYSGYFTSQKDYVVNWKGNLSGL